METCSSVKTRDKKLRSYLKVLMYGSFLKEMKEVPKFFAIHPVTTLLGEDTLSISSAVNISDQARIAIHSWLTDESQFD